MQKDIYAKIISFLLGASWGIIILGALIIFYFSSFFGFSIAIFSTLVFTLLSLFLFLILDAFLVQKEKLYELQKQTKLLEKIYKKDSNS